MKPVCPVYIDGTERMKGNSGSKKRILFLVSSMQGGGAERVAALLCNAWAEAGHEVALMPTFSGRGECIYSLDSRVRLEFLADHVVTPSIKRFAPVCGDWERFVRPLEISRRT